MPYGMHAALMARLLAQKPNDDVMRSAAPGCGPVFCCVCVTPFGWHNFKDSLCGIFRVTSSPW
jgi:hypothetical protein